MFVDAYVANITVFAGNFAPSGWQFCQGQLFPITGYEVLFTLIGTTYGGDGVQTFALPDLRGRRAIHMGQGPGLPYYSIGQMAGSEQITLNSTNLPVHNHTTPVLTGTPQGSTDTSGVSTPTSATVPASGAKLYGAAKAAGMGPYTGTTSTPLAGTNLPIPTIAPYLAMNYIIAVQGIFPLRN